MVESALGVQQGCNLGPICYSAGSLMILKEFKANPPVGARSESGFVHRQQHGNSTTGTFSRYGSYRESYGMAAGTPGDRRHLAEPKEIAGPASRWSWARPTDRRAASDNGYHRAHGGPTGVRVVGVPVGTELFQRDFLQEAVNGGPADLVRVLAPMEDAQVSFQILRLSATSRLSHLLRTVPPSITCQAAANYDALVEWALASIIAGDGAAAAGLPTPEESAHNLTVC